MNTDTTPHSPLDPTPASPPPQAWIGLDWGHKSHAFALQAATGRLEEGTLEHSAEALHGWLRQLADRFGGRPVVLAIECAHAPVIAALRQYPWLTLYSINPVTSKRYREAFTPSRASDDGPDARVLLELVRDHADKLRPFEEQDALTRQLDGLTQLRRQLVDQRTGVLNQLTALLRNYYPQALELVGDLDSDLAVDFLERWPDVLTLKTARPATLKRFYYAHNLRSTELVTTRLALVQRAIALTTDHARVRVAVFHLRALLAQLRALREHVAQLDAACHDCLAQHPRAALFRELPGAGPALAPRLCAAFGTLPHVYPEPASLQKAAGVAPVREKSGQQEWIHWRWQTNAFLRQTFVEWAGQTVRYSEWAKVFYERMVAKGKAHQTILRALAFRWIRILWKCWTTNTLYNETQYLEQLRRRKSPNAVPA